MNQKYNEANVDNRVLKADMETLRAKVWYAVDSNCVFMLQRIKIIESYTRSNKAMPV